MITKLKTLGKIMDCGLVAVVRAESSEQAFKIADACIAGGVAVGVGGNLIAGAKKDDYESITTIAKQFIEKIRQARGK